MSQNPANELNALAFGPHPDDVELCCGGTLALLVANGWRVGVVDLTRGELATNGTPEIRAAEASRASAILGLHHRSNLGLPDGFLNPNDGYDRAPDERATTSQVAAIVAAIRQLRPELVFAPWQNARHPDHCAAAELVTRACFFAGVGGFNPDPALPPFRPRRLLYYPMRVQATPTFVVDVSAHHGSKMAAIACYASQVNRGTDDTATAVNSPLQSQFVLARDRTWGAHIGTAFGEAFISQATLGVTDPVALFRAHAFADPLLLPRRPS